MASIGIVFVHQHQLIQNDSVLEISQDANSICFFAHQGPNQVITHHSNSAVYLEPNEQIQVKQPTFHYSDFSFFSANRAPPVV